MYGALLESYQQLQQDMAAVAAKWQECERRIDDYVDEQVGASLDPSLLCDDDRSNFFWWPWKQKHMYPYYFYVIDVLSKSACDNLISVIVIFVVEVIEVLVQDVNM